MYHPDNHFSVKVNNKSTVFIFLFPRSLNIYEEGSSVKYFILINKMFLFKLKNKAISMGIYPSYVFEMCWCYV